MDLECLNHRATKEEIRRFEADGFLVLPEAVPPAWVARLETAVDRIDATHRAETNAAPHDRVQQLDFIGKDEIFLELIDWPRTFPKVWDLLGWNVQLYYTAMTVTPPLPAEDQALEAALNWHQDSAEINPDLETDPRPRLSLKVAFFLTDTTMSGGANFMVLPGSHVNNTLNIEDVDRGTLSARALRLPAGAAVIFDRRLWHAASPNRSELTRKVLFCGYSYRWMRPRSSMTVDHLLDRCDPARRALFNPEGTWAKNIPLAEWLEEHQVSAADSM
jgi:ectoine hydroxylase